MQFETNRGQRDGSDDAGRQEITIMDADGGLSQPALMCTFAAVSSWLYREIFEILTFAIGLT